MGSHPRLAFLLDVDNTLLDNDALKEYLSRELNRVLGSDGASRFWEVYEQVRAERDVVDLPLTVKRVAGNDGGTTVQHDLDDLLDAIPFAQFLYPHALETLQRLHNLGTVAIVSDGDPVFQVKKIERSGLSAAVDGHVLVYIHKEAHIDEIVAFQPADHMVLIDDKARILNDVSRVLGARLTTVHVLQGHYAREPLPPGFHASITVQAIGDLRHLDATQFISVQGERR